MRKLPFQSHSPTSRAAATAAAPSAQTTRSRVLQIVRANGPMTDQQIQDALKMDPSTERPRRVELVNDGFIEAQGEGTTKTGRKAVLWGVK